MIGFNSLRKEVLARQLEKQRSLPIVPLKNFQTQSRSLNASLHIPQNIPFAISNEEKENINKIDDLIKAAEKPIAIFPGKRLDPDSVGSSFALAEILEKHYKKEASIIVTDEIPSNLLKFAPAGVKIGNLKNTQSFKEGVLDPEKYSLGIAVDIGNLGAFATKDKDLFLGLDQRIQIDHHSSAPDKGEMKLSASLVDNHAPSAGMLISKMMEMLKIPQQDTNIASNLYLALIGDTGTFKYSSDSTAFKYAAYLVDKGANHEEVFNAVSFQSIPNKLLSQSAWRKLKSEIIKDHLIIYSQTTKKELETYQGTINDTQGISEQLRNHAAHKSQLNKSLPIIAFHMTEIPASDGTHHIKVSIRSDNNSQIKAGQIAANFNGGGHENAAGFSLPINPNFKLEDEFDRIAKKIKDFIQASR